MNAPYFVTYGQILAFVITCLLICVPTVSLLLYAFWKASDEEEDENKNEYKNKEEYIDFEEVEDDSYKVTVEKLDENEIKRIKLGFRINELAKKIKSLPTSDKEGGAK